MARNTKQVMVRMPPDLYERLERAADMTMLTPSAMARILVKQQLDYWDSERELVEEPGGNGDNAGLPKLSRAERRRLEREEAKKRGKSA